MEWCRRTIWPGLTSINSQKKVAAGALEDAQKELQDWEENSKQEMEMKRNQLMAQMQATLNELAGEQEAEKMAREEKVDAIREELTRKENISKLGSACMLGTNPLDVLHNFDAFEVEMQEGDKHV